MKSIPHKSNISTSRIVISGIDELRLQGPWKHTVKSQINTKLTNFKIKSQIEGYSGE